MEYSVIIKTQILMLALILAACSSSEKAERPQQEQASLGKTTVVKANSAQKTKHTQETDSTLVDALNNRDDEAIYRAASTQLAQNSQDPMALNAMGLYHLHKGRPLAAKLFFNKALSQKPNSSELHSNLGLVSLALKENREAVHYFKKAIELNPSDVAAGMNLASQYISNKDFNKAYPVLSLISSKVNRDLVFLNNYAVAAVATGKSDEAEHLYKDALKLNPNNREVLYNFAILQIDYQKKNREGLATLELLKLLGLGEIMKANVITLEKRAKAGLQ